MEGRRRSTNQTARFYQLDQWRGCEGASGTITLYCAIDMLVLPNIQGTIHFGPGLWKKGFRPSSFIKTNVKAANSCSMLSKLLQAVDSWQELPMVSKAIKTCEALQPAVWTVGKLWLQYDFTTEDCFNGKHQIHIHGKLQNFWFGLDILFPGQKFIVEPFIVFANIDNRPRYVYWHLVEWLKLKFGQKKL